MQANQVDHRGDANNDNVDHGDAEHDEDIRSYYTMIIMLIITQRCMW